MDASCTIRLAGEGDLGFLMWHVHIRADIVRRKIGCGEFLVAERGGEELLGLIQLEYLWSKVPFIALIRVLPQHRRRGIGKLLLGRIEDRLRAEGHKTIYSSSQADEPEPQQWHRHVGFAECGFISGINEGIGEIFFCKEL